MAPLLLSDIISAKPCPQMIFFGQMSKSYSWILDTHFPLDPRQSDWDNISLTAGYRTCIDFVVPDIGPEMLDRFDKGICLFSSDGVSCFGITKWFTHKSYRSLIPITISLCKYPSNSVFGGKGWGLKQFFSLFPQRLHPLWSPICMGCFSSRGYSWV